MKKLFTILAVFAMFSLASCEQNGGDDVNPNDKSTGEKIASVEEQMEAIANSLPELKATLGALNNLVSVLSPNNVAPTKVAPMAKANDNTNNGVKTQIEELEERIKALEEYIASSGANKEWLDATYATLEMYEEVISLLAALQIEVDALKEQISGSTYELFAQVDAKLDKSLDSMKGWVSEQLSGYYDIAEVDALFAQLEASLTEDSAELRTSIEELRESIEKTLSEMREEYKAAIAEAINENNGVITEAIAKEIEAVNKRIDSEISALNRRLDDIEARLEELENAVTDLINRIQSITYVPTHEDDKARVDCHNASIEGSTMTMDFIISPKSAVADIAERYEEILTLKANIVGTTTFVNLPITSCTADAENGVLSIDVECDGLGEDFFLMRNSAKAMLTISDGNNDRNTEYIPLYPRYHKQAENMIMYTTTDNKKINVNWVELPLYNDYYDDYGIIVVDGPLYRIPGIFAGNSTLKSITFVSSTVEFSVDLNAFSSCVKLQSVYLPENCTYISAGAFSYCFELKQINIPDNVSHVENGAFLGCDSLPIENGVKYADTYMVEVVDRTQTSYSLKDNTRFIGSNAFDNCSNLTNITIPDNVVEIGVEAFYGCNNLASVTLPDNLTIIENYSFGYCSSLKSITIPDSVIEIGGAAFYECSSLTNVNLPAKITFIGPDTFGNCWSLASVTIPNGVTHVGECAFKDCRSLTSITIPDSVTEVGAWAFHGCESLAEIYCKPTTPPKMVAEAWYQEWAVFESNASGRKIYVPMESIEAYKTAEGWSDYADSIVGYDFD